MWASSAGPYSLYAVGTWMPCLAITFIRPPSKPVIATDVGGTREVIEDGVTGILIPPGDVPALTAAIRKVLNDPALAAAMGKAGRERVVNHFAAHAIAAKTEEVYRRVLETT